jgi:hypothetical protein
MKPFIRFTGIVAVIIFGFLSILGSGGGGDDDVEGTPQGGITAFNFDASNTETAAQLAAAAMAFFPQFTQVGYVTLTTLLFDPPSSSGTDLLICANTPDGTSILSWDDADSNGVLSVGDMARLEFNNCDIDGSGALAAGTLDISITSVVVVDTTPTSVGFDVDLYLTINDGVDISTLAATFGVTTSSANGTDFTNVFTADDSSLQRLILYENGTLIFGFGCFNVTQAFTEAGILSGTYGLSASGVINASNRIMSLAGGPQLSFVSNWMNAGTKTLLSMAVPGCDAVGVLNGVSDSDDSYIDMVANGGGSITLTAYGGSGATIYSTVTDWDSLLNP